MKRYAIAHDDHLPPMLEQGRFNGGWHFIALDSHGPKGASFNLIVIEDEHSVALAEWAMLPPLFSRVTLADAPDVPHELLGDVGLSGAETTLEAVGILSAINPSFG